MYSADLLTSRRYQREKNNSINSSGKKAVKDAATKGDSIPGILSARNG